MGVVYLAYNKINNRGCVKRARDQMEKSGQERALDIERRILGEFSQESKEF